MAGLRDDKPDWALTDKDRKRLAAEAAGVPQRRRRWPLLVVALVLGVGGVASWQWQTMASSAMADAAPTQALRQAPVMRLASIDLTTMAPQTLSRRVEITGTTRPLRHATLSAQVSGIASEVHFRPGDAVRQGDVLVRIDTSDLALSLEQARANMAATRVQLELAERQLASTETLAGRGLSSASSLESAQSNVSATRAQLAALAAQVEAAEASIAKATIRAPFDGIVSTRNVEPNQNVGAGTQLFSLVDLERIEVEANLPLGRMEEVAPGQVVELQIESNRNRMFTGTVDRINPVAREGTRTITLYATLDNDDGFLKGGMFAKGAVVTQSQEDAFAVPALAVQEDQAGSYVLVVVDGEVERRAVELGGVWGRAGAVEVLSGLEAGDVIVNTRLERLEPGMQVLLPETH